MLERCRNDAVLNDPRAKKRGGAQRRPLFKDLKSEIIGVTISIFNFQFSIYLTISFLTMFTCSLLMRTK